MIIADVPFEEAGKLVLYTLRQKEYSCMFLFAMFLPGILSHVCLSFFHCEQRIALHDMSHSDEVVAIADSRPVFWFNFKAPSQHPATLFFEPGCCCVRVLY